VPDEPKQPWYKSVPGILTAATGFIAAMSGLVAGLNQLGVFRREPPPAVVGAAPAPADHTAQDSISSAGARPASPPAGISSAPPSVGPTHPATAPKPSPTPSPARTPSARDSAGAVVTIPKGTTISVSVPSRACAPEDGARRVPANVSAPVQVHGATALPSGTTAVLRLRRGGRPAALRVRLDSLVRSGQALPISSAQVQVPPGSVSGVCLRAGARVTIVLGEAVTVPRS
jgi:hypothetical protein